MADIGNRGWRRAAVWTAVAAVGFGLGVGVGTQLAAGGGKRPAVPAAVVADARSSPFAAMSPQAALEAAADYATVMAQLFPLDPDAARAVVAGDASDGYRQTLLEAVDTDLVPLQEQMAALAGRPMFRQSVLATRVVSFTAAPARAEVSVWVMLVAGQAGVADNAVATFSTVSLDLVFEHGGWKIDHNSELPGPTPEVSGAPTSVDVLVGRLDGFNDWRPQ